MSNAKLAKLFETQISLTEWLERAGHKDTRAMREEDNTKRDRIGIINGVTGMPYDKPVQFSAIDVKQRTPELKAFVESQKGMQCAIRLIPKKQFPDAPKLRVRGLSYDDALIWFDEQNIISEQYMVDFVPHPHECTWSTIFVVNEYGVHGEIYQGFHSVLTQGFYDKQPMAFSFDFGSWRVEPFNQGALDHLKTLEPYIHIANMSIRKDLADKVGAEFTHDYLKGYFETTNCPGVGTWFIDYNKTLGDMYKDFKIMSLGSVNKAIVKGRTGCAGTAKGIVRIVKQGDKVGDFKQGSILVCEMTSPDYLPFMQKAAAIVTDQGGILCHAAIVARELKIPCIVGTGNATKQLKTGDKVIVNANNGTVSLNE